MDRGDGAVRSGVRSGVRSEATRGGWGGSEKGVKFIVEISMLQLAAFAVALFNLTL